MTIAEAIQKAADYGYRVHSLDGMDMYFSGANTEYSVWTRTDNLSSFMIPVEETFLDPHFWRALGVALGWREQSNKQYSQHAQWWKEPWHHFLECLASGQTAAEFFASLSAQDSEGGTPDYREEKSHGTPKYAPGYCD